MSMTKEYRAELRDLKKARRKVICDLSQFERQALREIKRASYSVVKARMASVRSLSKIQRRIAILEGRIS